MAKFTIIIPGDPKKTPKNSGEIPADVEYVTHFPSFVFRVLSGAYVKIPVYFTTLKTLSDQDIFGQGMKRVVIMDTPPDPHNLPEYLVDVLIKKLMKEAKAMNFNSCLVLGPQKSIYIQSDTGNISHSTVVPWNTNWLSEDEFINGIIFTNGKKIQNSIYSKMLYFL